MFFKIYIAIAVMFLLDYVLFLIRICKTWNDRPEIAIEKRLDFPYISIIIAARNEKDNIQKCLQSIVNNDYSIDAYEVIVIDDHSDDDTRMILDNSSIPNLKSISMIDSNEFGKKAAIRRGVKEAKGSILLFTDADAIVPKNWIRNMIGHLIKYRLEMVTGPIRINDESSLLKQFQAMDVGGTMFWTASGIWNRSIYLANGANMVIRKRAFQNHVKSYRDDLMSGDDVFLIQSIAKEDPQKVDFIKSKEAIVQVSPQSTMLGLITQRLRWASKTNHYENEKLTSRITKIFLLNLLLLLGVLLALYSEEKVIILMVFLLFLIKIMVEGILLKKVSYYFSYSFSLPSHSLLSVVQCFYVCIIGLLSILKINFSWKGRKVTN